MCNENSVYVLPTIEFVGGTRQDLKFNLFSDASGQPFEADEMLVNFSVVSYLNKTGTPVINKEIVPSGNILQISLSPTDTVALTGKYVYQVSLKGDGTDDAEIMQGCFYITNNINKAFITSSGS